MTETAFDRPFPLGEPDDAFAQYFVGQSYLARSPAAAPRSAT